MLSAIDERRLRVSSGTEMKRKAHLGQFLTPTRIAGFMAGLFPSGAGGVCRLLDPGAGIGSLSAAFLERCARDELEFGKIEATAFELDELLHGELDLTLASYAGRVNLAYEILGGDFIEQAVNRIQFSAGGRFTHAILNPPYKKISSDSRHRALLRAAGIETVNLYSAFVALSLALLAPGGTMVAIIPRSFCNGPYYRPFRNFLLEYAAIRRMHLFESRNRAFRDDEVLQENIIVMFERGGSQEDVAVSVSTDDSFDDLVTHTHPFDHIVFTDDPERFIHVPTSLEPDAIQSATSIRYTLDGIGVGISTGPVVAFRLKEYLRDMPEANTVPMLYPGHFPSQRVEWPKENFKKSNAIIHNGETEKWLYPNGHYCVVRRFSSKEEKRRVVASVVDPRSFGEVRALGFENHLNVFHQQKRGLPEALAHGLAVYLNTTAVDDHFRQFNGHTQVNATDLRLMKYPSRDILIALGEWAMRQAEEPAQEIIDEKFRELAA